MQACNAQIGSKKKKFWLGKKKKTFVKIKTTKKCCNFMKFFKIFRNVAKLQYKLSFS